MGALLEQDRLFINQKAKLIELTNEYAIRDEHGTQIGTIRQEGQTVLKKVARFVSSLDQFMTHHLSVYDAGGAKVCSLTRPRKIMRSKVEVADGAGVAVGTIVQKNVIGKIRFAYTDPGGASMGGISAENWRAWNFSITDPSGAEVARITKKWAGVGKELFTTADNYLLEITGTVSPPLRLMILASAAGVDLALKQDSN